MVMDESTYWQNNSFFWMNYIDKFVSFLVDQIFLIGHYLFHVELKYMLDS